MKIWMFDSLSILIQMFRRRKRHTFINYSTWIKINIMLIMKEKKINKIIIIYIYIYIARHRKKDWDPFNRCYPATCLCISQDISWISNIIFHGFKIGGFVDHHCFKISFYSKCSLDTWLHVSISLTNLWIYNGRLFYHFLKNMDNIAYVQWHTYCIYINFISLIFSVIYNFLNASIEMK